MVERIDRSTSPEALLAATGRDRDQWRALLLEAGAEAWSHKAIADWLQREHGVDGWWAQGITVDFEQEHQGRLPGQQADGTFVVSRTRTVPGDRLDALAAVRAVIEQRHGDAHGENLAASYPVVRWRLDDGRRLSAAAQKPGASGTGINLTFEKLPDPAAMEPAKADIDEIFAAVTA